LSTDSLRRGDSGCARRANSPGPWPRPQPQDVHWIEIEIEMVDDDGVGIPGQDYLIVTPDKRQFTGVADSSGRARLDDIVAGQCWVNFRNLDNGAWRHL
jgi:hypothetical protein